MRIAHLHLEANDINLVHNCLSAIEEKEFFPDWEFQTLFGLEKAEFEDAVKNWPNVDLDKPDVSTAILGLINHLLGYPHGMDAELELYTKASFNDLKRCLERMNNIFG